jgi:predicted transcriptional regulator
MTSSRFSLRLEPELKTWLEEEAKRHDRSAGYVATQAIRQLKQLTDLKRTIIGDALAEADRGAFVSSESVTEWFLKLDTEKEIPFPKPDVFSASR